MTKNLSLFAILLPMASLGQVASDLYLPSLPAIAVQLAAHINWVQWSVSIYMVGYAFSQLLYGPISDGIGRKKPLLVGLTLLLLGSIVCSTTTTITGLLIGRCLQGIGAGAGVTLSRAILRDAYSGADLATFASYLTLCGTVLMAGAPLLGGYMQHWLGWRANFIFLSIYAALILGVSLCKLPETNQQQDKSHLKPKQWATNIGTLFTHRAFIALSIIIFCTYAGLLAWLTSGPVLMQLRAGLTPVAFGWTGLAMGGGYALGSLSNARVVKHLGVKKMLGVGLSLMATGAVLMLLLTTHQVVAWRVVMPMAIFFAGSGFVFANSYALALSPFAKIAGVAGGVFGFIQIAGGAAASSLLAHMTEQTQLPLAVVLVVLAGVAMGAFVWLTRVRS